MPRARRRGKSRPGGCWRAEGCCPASTCTWTTCSGCWRRSEGARPAEDPVAVRPGVGGAAAGGRVPAAGTRLAAGRGLAGRAWGPGRGADGAPGCVARGPAGPALVAGGGCALAGRWAGAGGRRAVGLAEARGVNERTPSEAMGLAEALAAGFARLDAAARADTVVGTPRQVGERVLVPLAEVWYGGGFGLGGGRAVGAEAGGQGGGGGFGGRARPVAVVVVGPEGARVRPVVDATLLGLAAAGVALGVLLGRLRRR